MANTTSDESQDNKDLKGTPPTQGGNEGQSAEIDFSKLSDEQISKALEDKRFWKLPRIVELREAAKKAKEYEENEAARKDEELKRKGEFEALAKSNEDKAKSWEGKYNQSLINNQIMMEAGKQGITRLDLVEKLINKSNIKIDGDGDISGVTEAIKALIKDNDFLKGNNNKGTFGGGSNPPAGAGAAEFTLSQIQDPAFYQANRDKIMRAQVQGKIIDDR